jgi:hypothetical protein
LSGKKNRESTAPVESKGRPQTPKQKKVKIPTARQIAAEITALQEIIPRVRRFSVFNDDHHAAIIAQIRVLQRNDSEDDVEQSAETEDWPENVRSSAMSAAQWLQGEYEGVFGDERNARLVDDWKSLEIKPAC